MNGVSATADEVLTVEQVCALLKVRPAALYAWRQRGKGPAFVKVGKLVPYRRSDLERWIAQRVRLITSDQGHAGRVVTA